MHWFAPELRPGSIVRVDRYYARRARGAMSHLLWLVEQPHGLTCCQLRWIDDRQIVLLPSRPALGTLAAASTDRSADSRF